MSENNSPGPFTDSTHGRVAATVLVLMACLCAPISAEDDPAPRVTGQVLGEEQPVSSAQVYAYDLATYALEKVMTDQKGRFLFETLPAGLYKVIAHKQGFVPAVEMLLRRNPDARQFMKLHLTEEKEGETEQEEDYWHARARIPADVLHQIQQLGLRSAVPDTTLQMAGSETFEARMGAHGGVAQLGEGSGNAQLADASVEVRGALGQTRVSLDGRYTEMTAAGEGALALDSEVQSMVLTLDTPEQGHFSLTASTGESAEIRGGEAVGVGLEHYRVGWSGKVAGGDTAFSVGLVDENHYYNAGLYSSLELPDASKTLDLRGSYHRDLTSKTSLTTGMSYRQREGFFLLNPEIETQEDQAVDFFGVADSQIQPRVMVEYGLYSTLRDGEISLMPHGGVVVKLGSDWQARTSFAQRVEGSQRSNDGLSSGSGLDAPNLSQAGNGFERFSAAFFNDQQTCRQSGETCYEVSFERDEEKDGSLSLGAIHREFAETLRLYFSDDFFNRLESVVVVPGDQIPELKFRMIRQISPRILAKLESNIAAGGGGIFYATDEQPYENQVRYLVTSLDTRFQKTSTGVFLAFHHLEQELNPVASRGGSEVNISELEIQRLQLMLTQDLSALVGIAPNLAVRFNMELSRGATPYSLTDDDELRKKLTGGISLSF